MKESRPKLNISVSQVEPSPVNLKEAPTGSKTVASSNSRPISSSLVTVVKVQMQTKVLASLALITPTVQSRKN